MFLLVVGSAWVWFVNNRGTVSRSFMVCITDLSGSTFQGREISNVALCTQIGFATVLMVRNQLVGLCFMFLCIYYC